MNAFARTVVKLKKSRLSDPFYCRMQNRGGDVVRGTLSRYAVCILKHQANLVFMVYGERRNSSATEEVCRRRDFICHSALRVLQRGAIKWLRGEQVLMPLVQRVG